MGDQKKESLKKNILFNVISQVVTIVSPLVVTSKLARVFGADYLGVKSYTFSIVYYFAIFGVLGLDIYGQRKIAIVKDDKTKCSKAFCTIYATRFLMVLISTLLFFAYIVCFSNDSFERTIFFCWLIYMFREMINPIWFLQGIEKYRMLSMLSIISQIAYVCCTVLFINEKSQLPLYIVFFSLIPLIISFLYFPAVLRRVKFVKISLFDMVKTIKESVVYFVPAIANAVYSMVDKTMLGVFDKSKVFAGQYEAAEKLIKVALAFSTASFTIMRTRMSYLYEKNNTEQYEKYCRYFISFSMLLCWPIMFGIIGISKDFVPLFLGEGFKSIVQLTYVFAMVIPCLTISGLIQAIYIIPFAKQKSMDIYYVLVASMNVVLNFILIQMFETLGAIVASIVAELMLAVILVRKARKDIKVTYIFLSSIKYIISAVIMCICLVLFSKNVIMNEVYKVIIEFVLAVVVYFVSCFFLRDRFVLLCIESTIGNLKKILKR